MVFTDRVQTITQDKILPVVVDQVLNSTVFVARLLAAPKRWSGETYKTPIRVALNSASTGGSFDGLDTFTSAQQDTRKTLVSNPKAYARSVIIGGIEQSTNETDAQVLSLVKTEMETAKDTMIKDLGTLFYGDGTGNSGKNFNGLNDYVDDGTVAGTFRGLSRTTYPVLKSYYDAATGVLAIADFKAALKASQAASNLNSRPNIGIGDQTTWDIVEALFALPDPNYTATNLAMISATSKGMVRDADMLKGAQGYVAVSYRGIPIVGDDETPTGRFYFLNETEHDFVSLKGVDLDQIPRLASGGDIRSSYAGNTAVVGNAPIQWRSFQTPDAQYSKIGHFIMLGNFVGNRPNRCAVLKGITG